MVWGRVRPPRPSECRGGTGELSWVGVLPLGRDGEAAYHNDQGGRAYETPDEVCVEPQPTSVGGGERERRKEREMDEERREWERERERERERESGRKKKSQGAAKDLQQAGPRASISTQRVTEKDRHLSGEEPTGGRRKIIVHVHLNAKL